MTFAIGPASAMQERDYSALQLFLHPALDFRCMCMADGHGTSMRWCNLHCKSKFALDRTKFFQPCFLFLRHCDTIFGLDSLN